MGVKWKTVKNDFPKMEQAIKDLHGMKVKVGVLKGEQAWLSSIHEYGCKIPVTDKMRAYLHKKGLHLKAATTVITIPERSFLRAGFDEHHKEIMDNTEGALGDVLSGTMKASQYAEMIGLELKGKIQEYARDLNRPANHPYTTGRKGTSNPLVDSGEMINGISCEVE